MKPNPPKYRDSICCETCKYSGSYCGDACYECELFNVRVQAGCICDRFKFKRGLPEIW